MKKNDLLNVANFIMVQEMNKFQVRIEGIVNDITNEINGKRSGMKEHILADLAIVRFFEFYPEEPFFESIFNNICAKKILTYRSDESEDEEELRKIDRIYYRRESESLDIL